MKMTKKEKTLVAVLGIMVYLFVFVKFVLIDSIAEIKSKQESLVEMQMKKAALDQDYQNIGNYEQGMKTKQVTDERLGEYLMNKAGLPDSIVFIENLAILLQTELKGIALGKPQELSAAGGAKYYGFPVSFNADFPFGTFQEVIRYCEGASKKVRVSGFNLRPSSEEKQPARRIPLEDQLFDVSMNLVFYSIDQEATDKLYQFSRSRFSEFRDTDGSPIFLKDDEELPVSDIPNPYGVENKGDLITQDTADFIIYHRGYLIGGYNFETYSAFNSNERIRRTIAGEMNVILTLDETTYTLHAEDLDQADSVTGSISGDTLTLHIESNVVNGVKENENLRLNIKIINDSDKRIRVKMEQNGNRVHLMDRDGNIIDIKDDEEKVYF